MSKPNDTLTYERAIELLTYQPETGRLRWIDRRKDALSRDNAGCLVRSTGYRRIRVDGIDYQAHRVAWLLAHGAWPRYDIDHVNGQKDDNRLANLRDVPRRTNSENQRSSRRGLLGASFHKHLGLWRATIGVNYRRITLGYFATPEEAHAAYVEAKRKLHAGCTI